MACDAYTVLLLHCNGADASTTFTDSAPTPKTITANGNAQVDTAQFKFGGASLLCDGTGDYLSTPSHADFNFGTAGAGDFTVEGWVRFASTTGYQGLVQCGDNSGNGWQIFKSTDGTFGVNRTAADFNFAWGPSADTWYHWAVVRSGGTITVYINGSSVGTVTDGDFNNDSQPCWVGRKTGAGGQDLNGWEDEVKISKGIARWTGNFTPETSEYCASVSSIRRMMLMGCS